LIEQLITKLVQQAPELDSTIVTELRDALWADGRPLALAIGRVLELVAEHLVDAGIALPALAEAIATLAASHDPKVLEAARYQVDTLVPKPDVPVNLVRRRQT
jgi:hypothetical protein